MSSIYRASDIHSQVSDTIQPQANFDLGSLEFHQPNSDCEKSLYASLDNSHHYRDHHHCEHGQPSILDHLDHHSTNWKRYFLPTIFVLVVTLGGLLAWSKPWRDDLMRWAQALENSTSSGGTSITKRELHPIATGAIAFVVIAIIVGFLIYRWKRGSEAPPERIGMGTTSTQA